MTKRERVEKAVSGAIDDTNKELSGAISKDADAPLYGKGGKLESLDFVTFIVEVESRIQSEFGIDFMLTDENLLSKQTSPFSTVGSLIDHLVDTVEAE